MRKSIANGPSTISPLPANLICAAASLMHHEKLWDANLRSAVREGPQWVKTYLHPSRILF